jgi:hypothetical protein
MGVSAHRPEFEELCAGYALGSLDAADRARLEAHLAEGCAACEAALAEFSAATVLLAASAPSARPSAALRDRVMAAVGAESAGGVAPARPTRPEPPAPARPARREVIELPRRSPWAVWAPVAAAAALAVATAVSWYQSARLGAELAATRARLEALERSAAADSAWNTVLGSPFARHAVLEPTTAGDPRLRARASYDPGSQRAVVVFENLAAPADRDFELWVIRDGAPVSLGVVQPDERGRATVRLENVGISPTLSAFAVSLEPKGGSPRRDAPTGPVVMLGPLSG